MFSRIAALLIVIPGLIAAQAAAEGAIGAAKAATTTAPAAQAAGRAIGAGFDKIGRVFQDAIGAKPAEGQARPASNSPAKRTMANSPAKRAVAKRRPAPTEPPAPAVSYEDPASIQEGMEYDEVMRRFGPPSMKFSSGPGEELLSYTGQDQSLDVQMRNGKVTSIQKIGGADPAR